MPVNIERDIFVLRDASCVAQPIEYVQGTNAVPILLHVRDYDIPAGSTARVYVQWPSTKGEYDESGVSINENDIRIEPKDTLFSEAGKSLLQICIVNGEKTLVTFSYPVMVKKNYVPGITDPAKNQSDFIEKYLGEIRNCVEVSTEIAKGVIEVENNVKNYMESSSSFASASAQSEDAAKFYAESSKENAELSKQYREQAFSATPQGYEALVNQVGLMDIQTTTDTTLRNSKAGGLQLVDLEGNVEQKTYKGNQLFDFSGGFTSVMKGVTYSFENDIFTMTGDGVISYQYLEKDVLDLLTNNVGKQLKFDCDNFVETNTTYTGTIVQLVVNNSDGTNEYIQLYRGNKSQVAYTIKDGISNAKIQIFTNNTASAVSNVITFTKPILHFGEEKVDYEPYLGGVELISGWYQTTDGKWNRNGAYVCNKSQIPCKENDVIEITTEKTTHKSICTYNNGVFVKAYPFNNTVEKATVTIPSGVTHFNFSCADTVDTTPETIGRVSLTVNGKPIYVHAGAYTGGMTSPSPYYPQSIENFGDCVEMMSGGYTSSGYIVANNFICNKRKVPCVSCDVVKVLLENANDITIHWWNENTYISHSGVTNVLEHEVTIPSGATHFTFNVYNANGLTLETVGKVTLTINGKYVVPIKMRGKNRVDFNNLKPNSYNGITCTPVYNSNGKLEYINANGTATEQCHYMLTDKLPVRDLVGCKVTCSPIGATSETFLTAIGYYNEAGNWKNEVHDIGNGAKISNNYPNFQLSIIVRKGTTLNNVKFYPMVSEDGGDYAPYTEHTEYIYLDEPPRKVGDVADVLCKKDGVWGVERNVKEVVLDGSTDEQFEMWNTNTGGKNRVYVKSITDAKPTASSTSIGAILCDSYVTITAPQSHKTIIGVAVDTSGLVIFYDEEHNSTVSDWQNYLQNNPITTAYLLATPTFTPLDAESQKALNRLVTYDDVTYIEFDSKVQPSGSKWKYGTSEVGALALLNQNELELKDIRIKELESEKISLSDIYTEVITEEYYIPEGSDNVGVLVQMPLGGGYKPLLVTSAISSNPLAVVTRCDVFDESSYTVSLFASDTSGNIRGTVTLTILMIKIK